MIAGSLELQLFANVARLQRDMDSANRVVGSAMSSMSRSIEAVKRVFGAMAAAFVAFGATRVFTSILNEQEQFQRNMLRTEALLKSNGHAAGLSSQQLRKNAQELALATLQSVEGVERGQQILLTFTNITGDTFLRATEAAADLATVTGGDLNGSMTMLGKALNDPVAGITAMTRAGVSFSEQQKATIKKLAESNKLYEAQKMILDELARQYGGVAKAEAGGFAGAMDTLAQRTQEAKIALADYFAIGSRGADLVNWWAAQVNKFGEAVKSGAVPVAAIGSAFVAAAKVAAAYFAVFVAAPAVYAMVAGAAWKLISVVATYTMNVLIGQAATIKWNTALFGTSITADLAAASVTRMGLAMRVLSMAGSVLVAAFAGWTLGTWLREFQVVRVAGLAFVGALMKGWEHIKYGAEMAWEGVKFAWDTTVNAMKTAFADYLSVVSRGLSSIGASSVSKQVAAYANSLRATAGSQKTFAEQTAGITAAHGKAIDAIDANITELVAFELSVKSVAVAEAAAINPKAAVVEATEAQKKAYQDAVKSANNFIDAMKIEGSQIGLGADQIKMMTAAREAAKAPEAAQRKQIMELALANDIATKAVTAKTEADKLAADAQKDSDAGIASINAETQALILKVKTYGMLPEAITAAQITELEASKQSIGLTDAGIADIQRRIDALKGLASAQAGATALDNSPSVKQAKDLLEIMAQVDAATKSAADGMVASFGRVGSAIGGLTTALSGYGRTQAAIAAQLAADKADPKNAKKLAEIEIAATRASAQARVKSYGDMAGAAKGFFKENSTGYKVMEGTEKAFRAYEMAMALKSMALSLFVSSTKATGAVAGQAVETGAVVAGEGARNLAKIPGVFMSFMSAMGPWGAAAAAVAIAAVLGGASKNSGGGVTSESRQKSQGAGSVLGDPSAKSESISKSLEIMERNSGLGLAQGSMMVTYLRAMATGISGMASLVVRTAGVTGGYQADQMGGLTAYVQKNLFSKFDPLLGGFINKIVGKIGNAIFGGKTSVTDTGFAMEKDTLGGMLANGVQAYQYTDVKKDGGAFHSNKYSTDWKDLPAEANSQFGKIIANMASLLTEAGGVLGIGGDAFTTKLKTFIIDINKMSFKDMKGDEIQKAIENIFSKLGDDMARFAIGGLDKFTKVGEGYLETVARVVNDLIQVKDVFAVLGKSFELTGTAAINVSENLIEAAGGLEKLTGSTQYFIDNFMTEAERLAPVSKFLAVEMNKLGLSSVTTRDQFKDVVLGLDLTSDAGQKQYVAMMALQEAFAKVYAQTKDLTKSQQEIADERASLQGQLDELTMSSAQLLNKQRMALDASNRGLFDQIQGIKALRDAQEASKTSLSDMIGKMKSFGDSARTLRDGLMLGSLSTLTPMQQYAEARRQRDATRAAALGGDTTAQSSLSAMQTAFLTISQKVNGGDAQYSSDFAGVVQMSDEIAKWSAGQVDVAQASLDALNKQVLGIADLNASMLDVVRAVELLPPLVMPAPVMNWSGMGTVSMEPLVAEIKALRQEVTTLRAEQKTQTGDLITSAAATATRSDTAIVTGVSTAIKARSTPLTPGAYIE